MAVTALRHHLVVVVVAWKKSRFAIPLFALHCMAWAFLSIQSQH